MKTIISVAIINSVSYQMTGDPETRLTAMPRGAELPLWSDPGFPQRISEEFSVHCARWRNGQTDEL